MIRLAVNSSEEAAWRETALRLRGATIAACGGGCRTLECDAVVFVGPSCLEREVIEPFLHAGKHVLLTVEACLSEEVLELLSVAARQGGGQLAIVNPDRYLPSRQLIRQQLDAGKLGEVGLVRLHRWWPTSAVHKPEASARGDRMSPLAGASGLYQATDLNLHGLPAGLMCDLDLVGWLIGKLPNLLYAVGHLSEGDEGAGSFVQVHCGYPDGGMALIDCSEHLPPGDGYQSLSVIGSAGTAYADDHQNMQLLYRGGPPQAVRTEEGSRQLVALVQDFVDALNTNKDLSASVSSWRVVLTMADAVRRSLDSKQAVHLGDR
jgi:predicted dehydrogenase